MLDVRDRKLIHQPGCSINTTFYRNLMEILIRVFPFQEHASLAFSRLMTHTHTHTHIYIYIYICRTAPLASRCCILYIYSTNICTEYIKYAAHSPVLSSSKCRLFYNATFFGSCITHILNTECAKI